MKKCCNDRFLNQQMYLNAVNQHRHPPAPPKPPKSPNGVALTYRWQCGQICLHCDEHTSGISLDVTLPKKWVVFVATLTTVYNYCIVSSRMINFYISMRSWCFSNSMQVLGSCDCVFYHSVPHIIVLQFVTN